MRALKGLALAAAAAPLLGACVVYDSTTSDTVSVRMGPTSASLAASSLEPLRSVRFEPGAMVVRADSNGCTSEASFAVHIAEAEGPAQISLTREAQDLCKALVPDGVELRWTFEELGLTASETAVVQNPVRLP
jgi:hypothetical protein